MTNYEGPSVPTDAVLIKEAPLEVWVHAKKQAVRSPMNRFKVGCVLFNPSTKEIVAKGAAHPDIKFSKVLASVHAERHAIYNLRKRSIPTLWAVVFTYNHHGGCAWTSRPCTTCAYALYHANVERVIFAERTETGGWLCQSETPDALIARASVQEGFFARQQRIAVLS